MLTALKRKVVDLTTNDKRFQLTKYKFYEEY
jgi:hypothetical protein